MGLRRTALVMCLIPLYAAAANAQFPSAPPQQGAPPQQDSPCVKEFFRLRDDAEKKAAAIKAAGERKAQHKEVCQLFTAFVASQTKLLKYTNDNNVWCGIPAQVAEGLKQGLAKTSQIRDNVCRAAAAPQQQGPSLSDALSNPVPDSNNIKTGRGTFDTLTGNPLGK
ncbi:MAG TPA: hypothetical protein VEJ43_03200 [Pseudolabrys sp.]|nr:hypothetical protein [Pseudolabrys sp.]